MYIVISSVPLLLLEKAFDQINRKDQTYKSNRIFGAVPIVCHVSMCDMVGAIVYREYVVPGGTRAVIFSTSDTRGRVTSRAVTRLDETSIRSSNGQRTAVLR